MTQNTSPIIAKVCKSAATSLNRFDKSKDLLCAKITNIHEDGSRRNTFVSIENYKQPFWLVKEDKRKFKQHKDYIEESVCKPYKAPRSQIAYAVSKFLYGRPDRNFTIREASNSPYVFGLDQTPAVHFKQRYFERYGDYQETESYTVAAYDVEGDMTKPGVPLMMASITMKDKAFFAAVRSWYPDKDDATILRKLKDAEEEHLKSRLADRNCTVEYMLVDTPGQVVVECFKRAHEWEPDWIASWNAAYDMTSSEAALLNDGIDPATVFCDPSIPREYQFYKVDLGRTHKVKENGDKTPLESQERWPTLRTMAKWQWIDFMSFYAIKRAPVVGKMDTYTLEGTSNREGVVSKLYTEEGRQWDPGSPQWHRNMQRVYPYIYSVYNVADNFPIEELNERTSDLSLSLPMLLKYSEFFNYVSQPKLISDTLSFMARKFGYVWGSTPANRDKTFTEKLPTLGDWIALLDTEKNAALGKPLFDGLWDVISNGRTDTSDIDVEGAYPHGTLCGNVSNKTTMMEVYQIQGADPMKFREIAVNYASSTAANAFGLCNDLFRFPLPSELVAVFEDRLTELGLVDELAQMRKKREEKQAAKEAPVQTEEVKEAA